MTPSAALAVILLCTPVRSQSSPPFTASGGGDAPEWLSALNTAWLTWSGPNPLLQDVTQLYKPDPGWNAFVEGVSSLSLALFLFSTTT